MNSRMCVLDEVVHLRAIEQAKPSTSSCRSETKQHRARGALMAQMPMARVRFTPATLAPRDCEGRVGLFFPFRGFDSVPCLVAAVELLCESRFAVDVFMPSGSEAVSCTLPYFADSSARFPAFIESGVPWPRVAGRLARFVPYDLYELGAGPVVRGRRRRAIAERAMVERAAEMPFTCLIGVDPQGLIEAQAWSASLGTPYMCWSLEILIREELYSSRFLRLKDREVAANRGALLTIVQDEDRASLLAAQNDIPTERIVHVPNAYRGVARRSKSYFAHQLLGIPAGETVVLAAGEVAPWAMSEQIVRSVSDWPEGFTLVVHSRFDLGANKHADRVVAAADPRRVRFSTRPLPPAQYQSLVDSADVGLALYEPQPAERWLQGNLRTLGLSSGKLAAYLRAGVPVIVSRLKGPEGLVDGYRCGIVIEQADQLPGALRMVRGRHDEFSANAIRAFDGSLSVDRYLQPVLTVLADLAHPTRSGTATRPAR